MTEAIREFHPRGPRERPFLIAKFRISFVFLCRITQTSAAYVDPQNVLVGLGIVSPVLAELSSGVPVFLKINQKRDSKL